MNDLTFITNLSVTTYYEATRSSITSFFNSYNKK